MCANLLALWTDDAGVVWTIEWLFWVTIAVIGLITGMVAVRQAILSEMVEVGQGILALNQSFAFSGQSNCEASTSGSSASDTTNTITNVSNAASPAQISQFPCD